MNRLNKKGDFAGWLILGVIIAFFLIPLFVGMAHKESSMLTQASTSCKQIISIKSLSKVLCKEIPINRSDKIPLLFILGTFIFVAILMFTLLEEVPPFKNQIEKGKKAPAAIFALLLSIYVSFFTSVTKYLTIFITISGSIITYTIVVLFIVFIFIKLGIKSHKEGLNLHKEYYNELAENKRTLRKLQIETKEVSDDIRLAKRIEREIKALKKNDEQELKPLEQLELALKRLEAPLNKLHAIQDPNERAHLLSLFRQYFPNIIKLTRRIEKEYIDEIYIDKIKDKVEKELKTELSEELDSLYKIEKEAEDELEKAPLPRSKKQNMIEAFHSILRLNNEVTKKANEIEKKISLYEKELDDARTHKAEEIRAILNDINRIAKMISNGTVPTLNDLMDINQKIDDLKALIKHNEIIINTLTKLEKDVRVVINKIREQINRIMKFNEDLSIELKKEEKKVNKK